MPEKIVFNDPSGEGKPIELDLGQARRRLAVQTLLNRLIGCWAIALAIALGWFLVQPFAYPAASEGLSWIILGSLVGAGGLAALIWTWRTAPSRLSAALALDQRFDLRERVTSFAIETQGLDAAELQKRFRETFREVR